MSETSAWDGLLLERRLLGASGEPQCGPIEQAEEATGLRTAARSAGSRSTGIHGSWTVRPSCLSQTAVLRRARAMMQDMDAAHERLQEWDASEASSDVERETRTLSHEGWALTWRVRR